MTTIKKTIKKAQNGIKTKDSSAYFSNVKNNAYKVADKYKNSSFSGANVKEKSKKVAFKASDDLVRQSKKGKTGYDKNGYLLKKAQKGISVGKLKKVSDSLNTVGSQKVNAGKQRTVSKGYDSTSKELVRSGKKDISNATRYSNIIKKKKS